MQFRVGNDVPAFLLEDLLEDRVGGGSSRPQLSTFPVAEEHLAEVGFLDRFEADPRRERRRGLVRTLQCRHVDRVDAFVHEAIGEQLRLVFADRIERRVAVAVARGNGRSGCAGADSPCRTSTTVVAPGGASNRN